MKSYRWSCFIKTVLGLILLGFIVYVIVDATTTGNIRAGFESFLEWIRQNPVAGAFAFVGVYFLATVAFVPGSVLTLGAGFVFAAVFGLGGGVAVATAAVFVGASLGAIASFLLARHLLRDQTLKLTRKYATFEAIDAALEENGLKIFVLLRLSPVIPFNTINYIAGVTSISTRDYIVALLAIVPGIVLYCFLGASAGSLTESAMSGSDPTVTIVVVVLGVVFGIVAIWLTSRYARRELTRILEEREAANESDSDQDDSNGNGDDDDKSQDDTGPVSDDSPTLEGQV